ncbi:hypothetical protein N7455_012041 [Penicillium solitum]|uniref:uncharacterized protein n=1 Tax=Penicillium solitum TaxID=60172 RepID=UPI0032C3D8DD|nr:hypothetical protein N7455_012041 [Penicillium solitum]
MKSSSYILVALLPLATQLAVATPVADPHPDTFEERGGGKHGDHGYDDKNACEVKQTYPYYKYPCDSSPSNGTSLLGATFTSFCRYQNEDSGVWYTTPRGWVKEEDKPRRCPGAPSSCPV